MRSLEYGYKRAISEIVSGAIISIVISTLVQSGLLDKSLIIYFKVLNFLALIGLIMVVPYWGTGYLLGWLFGLLVMAQSGLVNIFDFIIYFGIPLVVLIIRLAKFLE